MFDLVVLSEIGYYFDVPDLTVIGLVLRSTGIGAQVLGVHWRGTTTTRSAATGSTRSFPSHPDSSRWYITWRPTSSSTCGSGEHEESCRPDQSGRGGRARAQ